MRNYLKVLALSASVLLAGCDGTRAPVAHDGPIRDERFCNVEGLTKPLRQTTIILDSRTLIKASNALEFAARNAPVRDAILSIADPVLAKSSGASAPRERIVLAVAPSDGSTAKVAFVGCLPGYTDAEAARLTAQTGALKNFVGGDPLSKLDDIVAEFRQGLIGGMANAALTGEGTGRSPQDRLANSPIFASLRASRGLFESEAVAQRVILISDLSAAAAAAPRESERKAGMAQGGDTGGMLRGAEINLLQPAGKKVSNREWLDGYLLAQQGFLTSVSSGRFVGGTPAPVRRFRFVGRAIYPSGPQALTIVLGEGIGGKLASSFMILGSMPEDALQMFGTINCKAPETCEIVDDRSGFAQAWRTHPGSQPQFADDMPFGGMRHFHIRIAGKSLTGEVTDESVIIEGTENHAIPIEAMAN